MKLNIVKIGNSLGIRLPQSLLKQCHFKDAVLVQVKDGDLILSPDNSANPRAGWAEEFKKMAKSGDDDLLDPMVFELSSDTKDWKW
jgi:Growth regulator